MLWEDKPTVCSLNLRDLTYGEQSVGSERLSLHAESGVNIKSAAQGGIIGPLYHPRTPSTFKVFHKQSIGFLYKIPLDLPSGPMVVGWLYIRVRAYK